MKNFNFEIRYTDTGHYEIWFSELHPLDGKVTSSSYVGSSDDLDSVATLIRYWFRDRLDELELERITKETHDEAKEILRNMPKQFDI